MEVTDLMEDAVVVDSLVKRFGPVNAVDGISFNVRRGEIFGILGPNGAGKSTTLSLLPGYLAADRGTAKICAQDIKEDRRRA